MTGQGPFSFVVRTYCFEKCTPQSVAINVSISCDNRTSALENVFQRMRNNFASL